MAFDYKAEAGSGEVRQFESVDLVSQSEDNRRARSDLEVCWIT